MIFSDLTAEQIMAYQGSCLFICALFFAGAQMPIPAAIALIMTFGGVFQQYKLRKRARLEAAKRPSAAA
jgi:hypothetical protein